MPEDAPRPIIKRTKKVEEAGHHGGAWKVAYADFVTAMMAFFMLMWLLNATTEKQRKGLADYFSPTIALSRASGGGDGALGGTSLASDAILAQVGRGGITSSMVHGTTEEAEAQLEVVEAALLGKGGESLLDQEELRHVAVRLSDEGVVIELFDLPGSPLFSGTEPTDVLRSLLVAAGPLLRQEPNRLAINAYVASEPLVTRVPQSWDRSTSRAQTVRRALDTIRINPDRVARLTGHGDRLPVVNQPLAVRNNRIEIVLLRAGA